MFKFIKKQKGITLISLVITIIVLLILAGVAILMLSGEDGILKKSAKASFQTDVGNYKEELELAKYNIEINNKTSKNNPPINVNEISETEYENIKLYIPSFDKKYEDKIIISNGKLAFKGSGEEEKWAIELGLEIKSEDATITIEIQGLGTVESKNNEKIENGKITTKVENTIKLTAEAGVLEAENGNAEYKFKGWYKDGEVLSTKTNYEFEVKENVDIKAVFETDVTVIYYLDENSKEKVKIDASKTLTGYTDDTIIRIEVGNICTDIDGRAFAGCKKLESITASSANMITLGIYAFENCTGLKEVEFPRVIFSTGAGNQFSGCTNLEKAQFGSKDNLVTTLGYNMLRTCNKAEVDIYTDIRGDMAANTLNMGTTINYYDKEGNLAEILLGSKYKGNTEINFTEIPNADKITLIRSGAFQGCTNLALTKLPENVTQIEASAFENCSKIQITEIPKSVISIDSRAFAGCKKIENLTANTTNTVKVATYAFENCTGLKTAVFPKVEFTGDAGNQFSGCTNLENAQFGSKGNLITAIATNILRSCNKVEADVYTESRENWQLTQNNTATINYYDKEGNLAEILLGSKYKGNTEINFTEIPNADKITLIRRGAFQGCTNLALTKLPENLTKIEANAFENCVNIQITEIPKNVTSIGDKAFYGCKKIENLTANTTNVVTVGSYAFQNCTKLSTVNFPKVSFVDWEGNQFNGCTSLEKAQFGSTGNLVTTLGTNMLQNCKKENLVIDVYTEIRENWRFTQNSSATVNYFDIDGNLKETI